MKVNLNRITRLAGGRPEYAAEKPAECGCEELRKAEHPVTKCMECQGKHMKNPGAFCNDFVHDECGIPRKSKSHK